MHLQRLLKILLPLCAFCGPPLASMAQSGVDLHQFDAPIAQYLERGQTDSALYLLDQKSLRARQADSMAIWAQTQVDIHEVFADDYARALAFLDKVWERRWRDPKNAEEWRPFMLVHANRGWFLKEIGRILPSIKAYEQAAIIFEKYQYQDFDAVRYFYKAYGNNYVRLGDNDKAIAVFQKALQCKTSDNALSGLYCDIGIAYWNNGNYVLAEGNYRKGLNLPGLPNDKRGLLTSRLAETMLDQGRNTEAARLANEAIRLLQPEGPDDAKIRGYRARARRVAGLVHINLGKFTAAESFLLGALSDDRAASGEHSREPGKDHIALSKHYLHQGQPFKALQSADQALSAVIPGYKPNLVTAQSSNLTNPPIPTNPRPTLFYEENTISEALSMKAAAAQALFEKNNQIQWLELALECHDLAWQAESILRKAFQYSSSKLTLQKAARDREESAINITRLLFEKTGQSKWVEKAFCIAERSKAALLLESLQDNLVRQRLSVSDQRLEEISALRKELSEFDKNLLLSPDSKQSAQWRIEADDIRSKLAPLEQALRKEYPGLSGFEDNTDNFLPLDADFRKGEALLEYFVSNGWLDVFVFQKGMKPLWKRVPNDGELQDLMSRFLAFFENDYAILNQPGAYLSTAFALGQKLLPAETAAASLLTVLPDRGLHFIPFEALLTAYNNTDNLRNAAYLLKRQELRYAWSLGVLRQQRKLQSGASNYLLSVAPGFAQGQRGLAPLAAADFGWNGIGGWDNCYLRGAAADLTHFSRVAGQYRLLHFSTHAFASENPRIELMDGSLLLPDLYAMALQADLVVLSACETGLGREVQGEGVMSLARAFVQAGAACIVSSLWSVNDQSTSRLLRYFYDNIGQGHSSGDALRAAKLSYLADPEVGAAAQSPYFWAGLVAVGDDRAIEQPWGWGRWGILGLGVAVLIFWGWKLVKSGFRD